MYTAIEIIKSALRKLSAYSAGDTLEADVAKDALNTLRDLLDSWFSQGIIDYTTTVTDFTLIPGTADYTLSTKTFKITNVLIRDVNDLDYKVKRLSEIEYNQLVDKSTQSRPCRYMERIAGDSDKSLTLYPVPDAAETLKVTCKSRPMDFSTLYTASTISSEANNALIWSLAAELWVEYPNPDVQQIVFGKAEKAVTSLIDATGGRDIGRISTDVMERGGWYNIDCDCYY